jgi:hypothetical protein
VEDIERRWRSRAGDFSREPAQVGQQESAADNAGSYFKQGQRDKVDVKAPALAIAACSGAREVEHMHFVATGQLVRERRKGGDHVAWAGKAAGDNERKLHSWRAYSSTGFVVTVLHVVGAFAALFSSGAQRSDLVGRPSRAAPRTR